MQQDFCSLPRFVPRHNPISVTRLGFCIDCMVFNPTVLIFTRPQCKYKPRPKFASNYSMFHQQLEAHVLCWWFPAVAWLSCSDKFKEFSSDVRCRLASADKMPHISVTYNPINQSNTFTSGDFISGQVILDVAKDTQMQSLSVKIKGKAEVCWTEHYGKPTVVYSDKEKYYSVKRFFVRENKIHGRRNYSCCRFCFKVRRDQGDLTSCMLCCNLILQEMRCWKIHQDSHVSLFAN